MWLHIGTSSCGGLAARECAPQPVVQVLVLIALVTTALAFALLAYNRITRRWLSTQAMVDAVFAPIARMLTRMSIRWPSKDPADYRARGHYEGRPAPGWLTGSGSADPRAAVLCCVVVGAVSSAVAVRALRPHGGDRALGVMAAIAAVLWLAGAARGYRRLRRDDRD
jgi:hypothetical protein